MEDIKTAPHSFPKPAAVAGRTPEALARSSDTLGQVARGRQATPMAPKLDESRHESRHESAMIDHTRLYFDATAESALWVRGTTWKARFGAENVQFIPFFGSSAPKDYPVTMRLVSVTLGGEPMSIDGAAPAIRTSNQVRYERGGLVENYDLGLDSIEQSFVFAGLPQAAGSTSPHGSGSSSPHGSAAAGDLALRLRIESELARTLSAQGVELANDRGRVVLGRATVRDAAGRTLSIESVVDGDEIAWSVPGEFLASASFPVTIDPVISVFAVDTLWHNDFVPDVAYDVTAGVYITVMEEAFSGTDHDIFTRTTDAQGQVVASGYVDISDEFWITPRVADNAYASQFMVVAEVYSDNPTSIRGRQASAGTLIYGPVLTINGAESGPKGAPDIGGDPSFSPPTFYLVTWQRSFSSTDSDIHAALFSSSGTNASGTIFIDNSASTLDLAPRVSKSDGAPPTASQVWTVVWNHQYSSTDNDIYGAQLDWDGIISQPTYPIDTSTANDVLPVVSSIQDGINGARRYMVASMRSGVTNYDVFGWICSGTIPLVNRDLSSFEGSVVQQRDQFSPAIDCDGKRFAVTFTETYSSSPMDTDVDLMSFEYVNGDILEVEFAALANTTHNQGNTSITSSHSGGGSGGGFMAVWDDIAVSFGYGDIYAAMYALPTFTSFCFPGIGNAQFCPCSNDPAFNGLGCNNSANTGGAVLNGNGSTSPDSVVLSAAGMLANANAIYLQGDDVVNGSAIFGDGVRCAGGHLSRLALKHSVGGASSYPESGDLSISARSAELGFPIAPGSQRFYQTYYRDPANYACTATFNVTNGIVIDW